MNENLPEKETKIENINNNENNISQDKIPDFDSKPLNIKFSNFLTTDSYSNGFLINTFISFQSINNIIYLIYTNNKNSIIYFNLINNQKLNETKNAHDHPIFNFRHKVDSVNNRDLILSTTKIGIKVWDISNYNCLFKFQGKISIANLLNHDNLIYILIAHNLNLLYQPTEIFDFKGNILKTIGNLEKNTYSIETYYDETNYNNYIITGHKNYIKSYNFNQKKYYCKYKDDSGFSYSNIIINNSDNKVKLIEANYDGNIRIWDFHSSELMKRIKCSEQSLISICIWDINYCFVGIMNEAIKLVDLKNNINIKNLDGCKSQVTINKIKIPKFNECLITQGLYDEQIRIWTY